MTRRTRYQRGRWETLVAAVLATMYVAPLAVAQQEDEDEPKEKRSAIMVFATSDSQDGEEGHATASAFRVTLSPEGGSHVKMFKMQDGKMVPVDGSGGMTIFSESGGLGAMMFRTADFTGRGFAEFQEDHPTADANEDGVLSVQEMRAFRVARAMSNADAVLAQFPHADGNGDGMLDVQEAAQLAGQGLMHPPMPPARILLSEDAPHGRIEIREEGDDGADVSMNVAIEVADIEFGDGVPHQIKFATSTVMRDEYGERRTEFVQTLDADGLAEMTLTVDGEELYHGPPPATWFDHADLIEPTREEVAEHMLLLEEADSARFLDMHPEADQDGDGVISEQERQALQATFMAQMLETHNWSTDLHEDGMFEMREDHRAMVEEVLRALESEGVDDPAVMKELEEALARARGAHGDVKIDAKRAKGKDSWVAIKDEFVRKHDFPREAIELADEVCEAAVEVRDKIIKQIEAIKTEHADMLEEEAEQRAQRSDELDTEQEGDHGAEILAESKPAKLIKRLEAKIEDIKQQRLIGGLEKIRKKIVR